MTESSFEKLVTSYKKTRCHSPKTTRKFIGVKIWNWM